MRAGEINAVILANVYNFLWTLCFKKANIALVNKLDIRS